MRLAYVAVLVAACGGGSGSSLDVKTSFQVTNYHPGRPSPLDPLNGQTIDIDVSWAKVDSNHGDGSDPTGCKSTYVGLIASTRTANGATANLVQTQILDPLPDWDVHLQLCTSASESTVILESVIDRLNLTFGCFGIPASAMQLDGAGFPELTSFTATQCSSTILDVDNNCILGNDNFSMTIAVGP